MALGTIVRVAPGRKYCELVELQGDCMNWECGFRRNASDFRKKKGGGLLALSIGCNALIRSWLVVGHMPLKVRFCALFRSHSMPIRGQARTREKAAGSFLRILPELDVIPCNGA